MEDAVKPLTDIPAINRFLSYCRVRTVPSKTVLIHAGDLPDVLYYIVRGSVEVMIEDEEGNEMVLAYLRSEVSILDSFCSNVHASYATYQRFATGAG